MLVDYVLVWRAFVLVDIAILATDVKTTAVWQDAFESLLEGRIANISVEFSAHRADYNVSLGRCHYKFDGVFGPAVARVVAAEVHLPA